MALHRSQGRKIIFFWSLKHLSHCSHMVTTTGESFCSDSSFAGFLIHFWCFLSDRLLSG